jgi:hypothetical protein
MENLKEQLQEEKNRLKALCTFVKNDILEWTEKDKEGEDTVKRGVFGYYYVSDDLSTAVRINLPVSHQLAFTSSYAYIRNPDLSRFKVVQNPINKYTISRINDMIEMKEWEINKKTGLLRNQLKKLHFIKNKYQSNCVHNWSRVGGLFADPVEVKTDCLGQEWKYYKWECKFCGKVIQST